MISGKETCRRMTMQCCTIEGCERPVLGRKLCSMHYKRWRKYGDPLTVKQEQVHGLTLRERFSRNVDQTGDCWLWTGYRDPNGYGRLMIGGRPKLAHRLSWELLCSEVPKGKCVLHKCDNPPCVNPMHLFVGTQVENMRDMNSKGRRRHGVSQGEKHGCAKLTPEQVIAIRESAEKRIYLASRYGVSRRQIADVQNGKCWRHLLE